MFEIPEKIFEKYGVSKAGRTKIELVKSFDLDGVTLGLNDSLKYRHHFPATPSGFLLAGR